MIANIKKVAIIGLIFFQSSNAFAQKAEKVSFLKSTSTQKIDVLIGGKPFTSFLFGSDLEKPVLFPLRSANQIEVTRGFPLSPKLNDPTDHPHHIGLWFNYESVNGLDFWNNSSAIPAAKKHLYGWISTDRVLSTKDGNIGTLSYHANWTNQAKDLILEETTEFKFSGTANQRIIDRYTTLTANTTVVFNDVKDGMLGIRLAHELQMPTTADQTFTDDKGNKTIVKGGTDLVPTGNYLTSMGKIGNDAWSSRAKWCLVHGKMASDSISVAIIDHPKNPNYPTFWHARGYGLFAANPLGEKVFTNGKSEKKLTLQKGESVTFRYRVVIANGKSRLSSNQINAIAKSFEGK